MHRRLVLAIAAATLLFSPGVQAGAGGGPAVFVSSLIWRSDDPLMGGMSAIEVATGGATFTALSDRGAFTTGRLIRDDQGHLTRIDAAPMFKIKGKGKGMIAKERADSEGLAIATDGTIYISFEGAARVMQYDRLDGPAKNLPRPDAFSNLRRNASLEAVAVDADGTVFTLAEGTSDDGPTLPVWRFRDGAWDQPFDLLREGTFLPVSADFGPDGMFYLLERDFRGINGFASRVRRFDPYAEGGPGSGEILLQTRFGLHDNLEGLAVWKDAAGDIRLTMISDDNFRMFQVTEMVEYRIPG